MKSIHIGTAQLPLNDFVVSRNAILGITKSGKTYLAKGIAEQLLDHGIPFVIFDAIGVWRHLKVPGDGQGYKVVVAGGEQPDLPLTVQSAPAIVRAAIAGNIPLVIDLYDPKLSKTDWRRIVQECFRILLYENKGMRHIFLEEAAEYAPQKVMDGQTYAEVEKLARMGGNRSLGITFINQRAQELNKAVLELCDNVILLRQRGTHAIDSLEKQMEKLDPATSKEIALSLPNMTQGDCWVFTENMERPIRTRSKKISSYHPDRRNPDHKILSKSVSADEFVQSMAGQLDKIIADAKANDPSELRAEIARLKREIKQTKPAEVKNVPLLTDREKSLIEKLLSQVCDLTLAIENTRKDLDKILPPPMLSELVQVTKRGMESGKQPARAPIVKTMPMHSMKPMVVGNPDMPLNGKFVSSITGGERKILEALIQYPDGLRRENLTIMTGYKRSSRDAYIQRLKTSGYVAINGEILQATQEGVAALPDCQPLPMGEELRKHWLERLGGGERQLLGMLIDAWPNSVDRDALSEATGYQRSSRDAYLQRLKGRLLVEETGRGLVKASGVLFEE